VAEGASQGGWLYIISLGKGAHIRCEGKGHKERCTPLAKSTAMVLTAWIREQVPKQHPHDEEQVQPQNPSGGYGIEIQTLVLSPPLCRSPECRQMPRSVRRLVPQDIDIAVLRADLIKRIVRAIPLVQDFLERVLTFVESKTNRPFVCLPSGIAIYFEIHFLFMPVRTILRITANNLQAVRQDYPVSLLHPLPPQQRRNVEIQVSEQIIVPRDTVALQNPSEIAEPFTDFTRRFGRYLRHRPLPFHGKAGTSRNMV